MKTLDPARILELNTRAREIQQNTNCVGFMALQTVAGWLGLRYFYGDTTREVWVNETGEYVNLRTEGETGDQIGDGGPGFDDQVEWLAQTPFYRQLLSTT